MHFVAGFAQFWGSTNIIRFLNFWNFFLSIIVLQCFCYLCNYASAIHIFLWKVIASYPEYISLKCFYKGYSSIQMTNSIIKWSYYEHANVSKTTKHPKIHVLQRLYITLVDWNLIKIWPTFSFIKAVCFTHSRSGSVIEKIYLKPCQGFHKVSVSIETSFLKWQTGRYPIYLKVSIGSKWND